MGEFITMRLSPNFFRAEFRCKCGKCEFDTVDAELLKVLQRAADYFETSVSISSAGRCEFWNRHVGGGEKSQHLYGRAADITVFDVQPDLVADYFTRVYNGKYGIGRYNTFTHIDTRGPMARWDRRT